MAINPFLFFPARRRFSPGPPRRPVRRCSSLFLIALLGAAACDHRPLPVSGTDCDLNRQSCPAATRWGNLRVGLSPRPLPALQPIELALEFASPNNTRVTARLEGVEMDMGPNLVTLQRLDATRLGARMMIPLCLTGTMKWRLALQIRDDAAEETVYFGFAAPLPGTVSPRPG